MSDYSDDLQELVGEFEFDDQPIELVDDGMDDLGADDGGAGSYTQAMLEYAAKATAPLDTNTSEQYSYVAERTGYTAPEAAYKSSEGEGFFDSLKSALTPSDKAVDLFGSLAKAGIAATPGILSATQSKQRQASQIQAQQRQISDGSLTGTLVKVGIGLTVAYVGYRILKKYL